MHTTEVRTPIVDAGTDNDWQVEGGAESIMERFSVEVMPRTAAKIDSFPDLLPAGTPVYIAHIEGTRLDDMLHTARRLRDDGYIVYPHITARTTRNREHLATIVKRYRDEAGIRRALLLAGGVDRPIGDFHSSIQMLRTGIFDTCGFTDLHVAGHPEGNRDIDRNGKTEQVDAALLEKQDFVSETDARMALVTQFAFESATVIGWLERVRAMGVTLPVSIGLAGPTKLQTLLKFAVQCGVGPSIRVLQRQAKRVSRLLHPFEPNALVDDYDRVWKERPDLEIMGLHFFPLGGIRVCAEWAATRTAIMRSGGQ